MTIALGVIGPFGTLIAADSEEGTSSPGDLKSSTNKISGYSGWIGSPQALSKAMLVSGAGDSGYLSAIKQHLIDDFGKDDIRDIDSADEAIRSRLIKFYEDHVIPFSGFANLDLDVSLVIGASFFGKSESGAPLKQDRLWSTYMNTVTLIASLKVAAVGSGEQWVTNIIPIAASLELHPATAAAAYGVFFAKEHATGCGKKTKMARLFRGRASAARQSAVDGLEGAFADYSDCEKAMRNTFLGMPLSIAFVGMDERLNDLRKRVTDATNDLWDMPMPSTPQTSEGQQ